ncbi:MAG: sulfatase-like hydrolase/transferase [Verrucomicrobiaceae bacterium]|nr:sulfatase-like hydrolase/transferase [Verrucomicrobiaceae bacterium]
MSRFAILCLTALAALHSVPAAPLDATSTTRPNVLYIFTDDQSVRTVSCYLNDAYPWVKTPNIDALAKKGVRFQSAYMAPYCMPARISMLTGNLPHASRGLFQGAELKGAELAKEIKDHPFWPQRLRENGYRTGMIGKWHITSRPPAVGIDWDTAIHWSKDMGDMYHNSKMSFNGAPPSISAATAWTATPIWRSTSLKSSRRTPSRGICGFATQEFTCLRSLPNGTRTPSLL